MYYNTTKSKGRTLANFQQSAKNQDEKVMLIYKASMKGLTASEVFRQYPDKRVPLTSIRRAITNLMNDKRLVKTEIQKPGMYDKPEYVYQIYTGQIKLF
jgi:hypothetical protein